MTKRVLSILLALALIAAVLAGCGNSSGGSAASGSSADTEDVSTEINFDEDPYTVNFLYLVAMEGADQQKVNDAVNELTLKELNMKVNMIPMTFGTYSSQISLMLSSGEALDIWLSLSKAWGII